MWKYIIIAYIIIAVVAYLLIGVGFLTLIESRYFYLPKEWRPRIPTWKVFLYSIFWPITLLIVVLNAINEFIFKLINKEE